MSNPRPSHPATSSAAPVTAAPATTQDQQETDGDLAGERDTDSEWSPEDRARWHAMYQEWREEQNAGRERGTNVVGDKPDTSPGDTSDLPPTGEQLLKIEPRESRVDALRHKLYEPEVLDGLHDLTENEPDSLQALFDRPPTSSHTEIPTSQPNIGPVTPEHASASEIATAGLVVGVLLFEAGHWARSTLDALRGR